jgi:hypothetical protein
MSTPTVASLIEGFPVPTIESIVGRPTYENITVLARALCQNAASILCENGGGNHGYLGLLLSPTTYSTLSVTPFTDPLNPGVSPIIPVGASPSGIRALERNHKESLRLWKEKNTVDEALKKQIISTVETIYLKSINNYYSGYSGIPARAMIDHLYARYGNINPTRIEENDAAFKADYDPSEPIEVLFQQIEETTTFASAAKQPYTSQQIITNSYNILQRTGLFSRSLHEWRDRNDTNKTWVEFQAFFTKAWDDNHEDADITSKGQGYSANLATDFTNDTAEAFVNFSAAAAADRTVIANLVATNQDLIGQLTLKDKTIADLRAQVRAKGTSTTTTARTTGSLPNNKNYCHTHGYILKDTHHSGYQTDGVTPACPAPGPNHNYTATRANIHGGSERNKNLVATQAALHHH